MRIAVLVLSLKHPVRRADEHHFALAAGYAAGTPLKASHAKLLRAAAAASGTPFVEVGQVRPSRRAIQSTLVQLHLLSRPFLRHASLL